MNEMMTYQNNSLAAQGNKGAASTTTEMMVTRQAQEVQAAMVVAKRFPRDENASFARIMQSCQRKGLAERAMYEYPRGGQNVTGPSIRLAEAMAQNWGNLDFGITELEQKPGESTVMAYCWDLETNTRQTKIFTVPHIRQSKKGAQVLTDPRDIYEMVANQGARRLRSCILGVIPGDIVDAAIEQCNKTLTSGDNTPLADRIRNMVFSFQAKLGVPKECLEKYIGCKAEAFTEQSVVRLRNVYNSIKEGRANREDYFDLPTRQALDAPAVDKNTGEVLGDVPVEIPAVSEMAQPEKVSMDDL